jgi:hypothetical protein
MAEATGTLNSRFCEGRHAAKQKGEAGRDQRDQRRVEIARKKVVLAITKPKFLL